MRDRNILFFEDDLDQMLRHRSSQVEGAVNQIPQDQFLVSTEDELVQHLQASLSIQPLQLHEDAMTMDQTETHVDVSGDSMRMFIEDRQGPYMIPGTRVTINLPYTGENWLFKYRTNPYSSVFPRSEVVSGSETHTGTVKIVVQKPHDAEPESFKAAYERELSLLRECVERSGDQIAAYNAALPNVIRSAVANRRGRLDRHGDIAGILDIPLAIRDGATPIKPVTIEVRKPPPLPKAPKSGLAPEPGIPEEHYEQILHFIRHQGRTFETSPRPYSVFQEEDLRDFILAQLNGTFHGAAAGEVFRRSGKTDIRIEHDDRAAFVAECKIWTGQAAVPEAIDQLLSYLTWRDSKSALVMFNKGVKGFSALLDRLPAAIREHPLFLRDLDCTESGEWRMHMRSAEDEGRRVTLHVFLFNIYAE